MIQVVSSLATSIQPIATLLESIVTATAILVAGWWTYIRFVKQEDGHAHIQTSADIIVKGRQGQFWVVELLAFVENKGKVSHKIGEFTFDLSVLSHQTPVETSDAWGGQVNFPDQVVKGSMIPSHFQYFVVGPSIEAKYSYVARVPISASFAILHCRFIYADRPHLGHSMEATIKLPEIGG